MVDEVIDIDEAIALAGAEFIFEEINPENVIYNNVEEDNSATGSSRKANVQLLEECLSVNQAQLEHLHNMEQDIRHILSSIAQYRLNQEKQDKECATGQRFHSIPLSFASPYFKIPNGPTPFPNRDTLAKKANMFEFSSEIPFKNPMLKEDQQKLATAVSLELSRAEKSKRNFRHLMTASNVEATVDTLDWKIIAHTAFNDAYSPQTCRLAWKIFLSPLVNRNKWTKEEDNLIKVLSTKESNWDEIARAVGNNRTPFLCYTRYARVLSKSMFTTKWSTMEDSLLVQVVDQCRIGSHIPWTKVGFFIPGRTRGQCTQRYNNSLRKDIYRGKFEREEDFNLIIGVRVFGKNWSKILTFLSNRVNPQITTRYNYFLSTTFSPWTPLEDQQLVNLVREIGAKNWVKVAQSMKTSKNRRQCRMRYLGMCRQKSDFPDWCITDNIYDTFETDQFKKQQKIFVDLLQTLQQKFNLPPREDQSPLTISTIHQILSLNNISNKELMSFMSENLIELKIRHCENDQKSHLYRIFSTLESTCARKIDPVFLMPYSTSVMCKPPKAQKATKKESFADRKLRTILIATYRSDVMSLRDKNIIPQSPEGILSFSRNAAMCCSILKHETLNFQDTCIDSDVRHQLEKAFQSKLADIQRDKLVNTPRNDSSIPPIVPQSKIVKTYVRKSKLQRTSIVQSSVAPAPLRKSKNEIQLLPPSLSSLVAMRCMLLGLHREKTCGQSSRNDIRNLLVDDQEEREESTSQPPESNDERSMEIANADEKLFRIFQTIFALPGIMTLKKPASRDDLFAGSSLSAKNPFPVEEIILSPSTSSRRRLCYRRRRSKSTNLSISISDEGESFSKKIKVE